MAYNSERGLQQGVSGAMAAGSASGFNPYVTLGGGALGLATGLFGGGDEDEEALELLKQNQALYSQLGEAPDTAGMIKDTSVIGQLTPEKLQAMEAYKSYVGELKQDPNLINQMKASIGSLQQLSKGNMTPMDQLRLQQIQQEQARQNNAQQANIRQEMQQRGLAGSGAEFSNRLAAQQLGRDNASNQGMSLYASGAANQQEAMKNALSALSNFNTNQNQFNLATTGAKDVAQKAAWDNSARTREYNTTTANQAQNTMYNRANTVADFNAQQTNARANATANRYGQNLNRISGMTGQNTNLANTYNQQAQDNRNMWTGIGNSAMNAGLGYANYNQNQQKLEQDRLDNKANRDLTARIYNV